MKRSGYALSIVLLALAPGSSRAEGLDASKPLLCSITEAAECDGVANCTDVTLEQIDLPPLCPSVSKRSTPRCCCRAIRTAAAGR